MKDPRINQLAETLVDHSCQVKQDENVLIEAFDLPDPALVCALVDLVTERGGLPLVTWKSNTVLRSLYRNATRANMELIGGFEQARMSQMDCYIGIRGADNSNQFSDVPIEQMDLFQKHWWKRVHSDVRVPKTRWVVLRYPTHSMAQAAQMSTEAFEDYYFDVCTADYARLSRDMEPLKELMEATDKVRIVSPGTDLTFSIKDIPVVPCAGEFNIPDGECFTAPVRDSVNGTITYNAASLYQGTTFDGIHFQFENGKIIKAESNNTERLNAILDADEGARYIGEWSLGVNNRVTNPMMDILFDEKIGGSMHLTPGQAYEEADNGNRSQVHWDLVLIQTPAFGGGELWFDDELVRKDGRFLPDSLQPLNAGLAD